MRLWRPCSSIYCIYTVSLVQWVKPYASHPGGSGSRPRNVPTFTMEPGSPLSDVLLHWWPQCDWSLVSLAGTTRHQAAAPRGDRLTWSHITCLPRFHSAPCRSSSSSLHHYLNTPSHWSSRSTVCFLPRGSAVHVLLHGAIYEEICQTFLWDTAHKNSIYWELTSRIHIFMETGLRICIFMEAGLWIYISMRHS